jgi:hypothetical protein
MNTGLVVYIGDHHPTHHHAHLTGTTITGSTIAIEQATALYSVDSNKYSGYIQNTTLA